MNESRGGSSPDELVFEDNELTRHNELEQQARENGYFVFEKSSETVEDGKKPKNKIHFLGLKTDDMMGGDEELMMTIESDIQSEEELQAVLKEIRMTPLFRKILTHVAECRETNHIPFLQSEPGTGKTFTYEAYNRLLHGNDKDSRPEYLICTPKTSELDIIGHWAPQGDSSEETKDKVKEMLDNNKDYQDFKLRFDKNLESLAQQKKVGEISDESFSQQVDALTTEMIAMHREIVMKSGTKSNWVFQKGALLRAYKDHNNPEDEGRMLIVDELDKMPPNVQNTFLQVSGSRARLAKTIITYADGDTTDYEAGENTAVGFAANYKGEGNVMISAPMMDRVTSMRIGRDESDADAKEQITNYSFNGLQEMFPEADEQTRENLREFLSSTLAQLHLAWKDFYRLNRGDWLAKGKSDEQNNEYSQRRSISLEDALLHKLQEELDGKANYRVTETVDAGGKVKSSQESQN